MKLPETLYHYTTGHGLLGILNSKKIWVSDPRYLNDGKELSYGRELFVKTLTSIKENESIQKKNIIESLIEEVNQPEQLIYISSFCEIDDLLSQWRGYGGNDVGYSIGFETKFLSEAANCELVQVIYNKEEQVKAIENFVEQYCNYKRDNLDAFDLKYKDLYKLVTSFKHHSFSEEREWRLIDIWIGWKPGMQSMDLNFRPGAHFLIPYREAQPKLVESRGEQVLPIKSVRLGPSSEPELGKDSLSWLLWEHRYITSGSVQIKNSECPFRL